MHDRQPGAPGQYTMTIEADQLTKLLAGETCTIVLVRDDQPIAVGTPYNKASVLPDDLAAAICPSVTDPTPADAFRGLLARIYTVTVPASGWYQFGAGYECQVSVPGLLVDDTPVVDLNMTGDGAVYAESNIALCDEYGKIFRAIAGADTMWIQATDIPGADLPIKIKVVR